MKNIPFQSAFNTLPADVQKSLRDLPETFSMSVDKSYVFETPLLSGWSSISLYNLMEFHYSCLWRIIFLLCVKDERQGEEK